jgi:hypothetical protein
VPGIAPVLDVVPVAQALLCLDFLTPISLKRHKDIQDSPVGQIVGRTGTLLTSGGNGWVGVPEISEGGAS